MGGAGVAGEVSLRSQMETDEEAFPRRFDVCWRRVKFGCGLQITFCSELWEFLIR